MALKNTIWINKLFKKFWNSKLKTYDYETILPDILLSSGYADINSDHLEILTNLAISAGINMPTTIKNYVKENCKFNEQYIIIKMMLNSYVLFLLF